MVCTRPAASAVYQAATATRVRAQTATPAADMRGASTKVRCGKAPNARASMESTIIEAFRRLPTSSGIEYRFISPIWPATPPWRTTPRTDWAARMVLISCSTVGTILERNEERVGDAIGNLHLRHERDRQIARVRGSDEDQRRQDDRIDTQRGRESVIEALCIDRAPGQMKDDATAGKRQRLHDQKTHARETEQPGPAPYFDQR